MRKKLPNKIRSYAKRRCALAFGLYLSSQVTHLEKMPTRLWPEFLLGDRHALAAELGVAPGLMRRVGCAILAQSRGFPGLWGLSTQCPFGVFESEVSLIQVRMVCATDRINWLIILAE